MLAGVSVHCKKTETDDRMTKEFLLHKDKEKCKLPTHKTTHLQAPTHKPMLQLAKELFSYRRTRAHPPPLKTC
jgi:hypothetical protein